MSADDTSLNTADKNTDTVRKELQRNINEAFDWCDNNAMILHPKKKKMKKKKSTLFATRQKHQLRPLHLTLSLKDSHINQVHEHRHLRVIIDDEFSWQPHITGTCKTLQNICICCHSSDTLWTLRIASCFSMLIFPLT